MRKKELPSLKMSSSKGFKITPSLLAQFKPLLLFLRLMALAALITALARPQTTEVTLELKLLEGLTL